MLTSEEHPVPWAMLMFELEDAGEHLNSLIQQMSADGAIEEADFRVQLGHVFAHLNRAWNSRHDPDMAETSAELDAQRSRFPEDLLPLG